MPLPISTKQREAKRRRGFITGSVPMQANYYRPSYNYTGGGGGGWAKPVLGTGLGIAALGGLGYLAKSAWDARYNPQAVDNPNAWQRMFIPEGYGKEGYQQPTAANDFAPVTNALGSAHQYLGENLPGYSTFAQKVGPSLTSMKEAATPVWNTISNYAGPVFNSALGAGKAVIGAANDYLTGKDPGAIAGQTQGIVTQAANQAQNTLSQIPQQIQQAQQANPNSRIAPLQAGINAIKGGWQSLKGTGQQMMTDLSGLGKTIYSNVTSDTPPPAPQQPVQPQPQAQAPQLTNTITQTTQTDQPSPQQPIPTQPVPPPVNMGNLKTVGTAYGGSVPRYGLGGFVANSLPGMAAMGAGAYLASKRPISPYVSVPAGALLAGWGLNSMRRGALNSMASDVEENAMGVDPADESTPFRSAAQYKTAMENLTKDQRKTAIDLIESGVDPKEAIAQSSFNFEFYDDPKKKGTLVLPQKELDAIQFSKSFPKERIVYEITDKSVPTPYGYSTFSKRVGGRPRLPGDDPRVSKKEYGGTVPRYDLGGIGQGVVNAVNYFGRKRNNAYDQSVGNAPNNRPYHWTDTLSGLAGATSNTALAPAIGAGLKAAGNVIGNYGNTQEPTTGEKVGRFLGNLAGYGLGGLPGIVIGSSIGMGDMGAMAARGIGKWWDQWQKDYADMQAGKPQPELDRGETADSDPNTMLNELNRIAPVNTPNATVTNTPNATPTMNNAGTATQTPTQTQTGNQTYQAPGLSNTTRTSIQNVFNGANTPDLSQTDPAPPDTSQYGYDPNETYGAAYGRRIPRYTRGGYRYNYNSIPGSRIFNNALRGAALGGLGMVASGYLPPGLDAQNRGMIGGMLGTLGGGALGAGYGAYYDLFG